jgi:recombination protein RecT
MTDAVVTTPDAAKAVKLHVGKVRTLLEKEKETLLAALPQQVGADRFIRIVCNTFLQNPDLINTSFESQVQSILEASALGLEPGGTLGHCYFVRYGRRCQMILGYRGMLKLMNQSGQVSTIKLESVREGDTFQEISGTRDIILHTKANDVMRHTKPITHVYIEVTMRDGGVVRKVMTRLEIEMHKEKTSPGWRRKESPWQQWWEEMAHKTLIRKVFKFLPMAVEIRQLAEREEDYERATLAPQIAQPVSQPEQQLTAFLGAAEQAAGIAHEEPTEATEQLTDEPAADDFGAIDQSADKRLAELAAVLDGAQTITACNKLEREAIAEAANAHEEVRVREMCEHRAEAIRAGRGKGSNKPAAQGELIDKGNPAAE